MKILRIPLVIVLLVVLAGRAFNAGAQIETNLHSFVSFPEGALPQDGLVQGSDGNFYGTTVYGGMSTNCYLGCGTVYRISTSGSYTSLYSFGSSPNDGTGPNGGLVQGYTGYLYGTTQNGGTGICNIGCGTVFLITPSGYEATLYSFGSIWLPNDGYYPVAGLAQGSDGNFYGTTSEGGTTGYAGTVFRISPSGTETSLYSFVGSPTDGNYPAGLVQGSDGNFYGTTYYGGAGTNSFSGGIGTVFRFSVPLNPPANQISKIASIQSPLLNFINISIPSVAGETYQLQFRTDLTSGIWSNVPSASVTNSLGGLLTLGTTTGANQPQAFYRFDITP